jgi:phosphoglycerate-specific signal transduction histidine kinase
MEAMNKNEKLESFKEAFDRKANETIGHVDWIEQKLHASISSLSQDLKKKICELMNETEELVDATENEIKSYSDTEKHFTFLRKKMRDLSGILEVVTDESVLTKKSKSEVFAVSPSGTFNSTNSVDS